MTFFNLISYNVNSRNVFRKPFLIFSSMFIFGTIPLVIFWKNEWNVMLQQMSELIDVGLYVVVKHALQV